MSLNENISINLILSLPLLRNIIKNDNILQGNMDNLKEKTRTADLEILSKRIENMINKEEFSYFPKLYKNYIAGEYHA